MRKTRHMWVPDLSTRPPRIPESVMSPIEDSRWIATIEIEMWGNVRRGSALSSGTMIVFEDDDCRGRIF